MADSYLQNPNLLLAIAIAGVLVTITWLAFGSRPISSSGTSGRGGKGPVSVVLVGPSDAGKTSIFAQLIYSTSPPTHPSLTASSASYTPGEGSTFPSVTVIDTPGHPRLKEKQKAYLKSSGVKGAVYVVDVGSLLKGSGASGIAEDLASVMSALALRYYSAPLAVGAPSLLILAHKADTLRSSGTLGQGTVRGAQSDAAPTVDEATLDAAIERTMNVLGREMTKLKAARATSRGRIEGMSAVPKGSSTGSGGVIALLRSFLGFGRSVGTQDVTSTTTAEEDEEREEDAERRMWGYDPASPFKWDEVEGMEIQWGATWASPGLAAPVAEAEEEGPEPPDGLQALKDWLYAV